MLVVVSFYFSILYSYGVIFQYSRTSIYNEPRQSTYRAFFVSPTFFLKMGLFSYLSKKYLFCQILRFFEKKINRLIDRGPRCDVTSVKISYHVTRTRRPLLVYSTTTWASRVEPHICPLHNCPIPYLPAFSMSPMVGQILIAIISR